MSSVNFRSVTTVSPSQVQSLDDVQLRDLMQLLLDAEGRLCKTRGKDVVVSHNLKAGDSGCDSWSPAHNGRIDWMQCVETCWQFKSGTAGQPSRLAGEVTKQIPRDILAAGGAYIVVASAASGKSQAKSRLKIIQDEAKSAGLPTENIDVYTCESMANWCNSIPAVAARFSGLPSGLQLFEDWANDEVLAGDFLVTESLSMQIEQARSTLDFESGTIFHLHLVGLPGVGRTRFALEAIRKSGLCNVVVYAPCPSFGVEETLALLRRDSTFRVVLVVDQCSAEDVQNLNQWVRVSRGKARLLTIGESKVSGLEGDKAIELKPLGYQEVHEIVQRQAPGLHHTHVSFVTRFSGGFVKLARVTWKALLSNPDIQGIQLLHQEGDRRGFLRRLLGDSEDEAIRSLHVVALLTRIGWERDVESEGRIVAAFLGLDWRVVQAHVKRFQESLSIVQSAGRYRVVSPRPLALYLASDAVDTYSTSLVQLAESLPHGRSQAAFFRRLGQLSGSKNARDICRTILDRIGVDHADFAMWSNVAMADRARAIVRMQSIFAHSSVEQVRSIADDHPQVAWTLEKMAWHRDTFEDAMLLLAEMAACSEDSKRSSTSRQFCERFQVYLGGTAVPFPDRLPLLDELLKRPEPAYHRLVIRALTTGCHVSNSRGDNSEDQDIIISEPEWQPGYKEDAASHQEALQRLRSIAFSRTEGIDKDLLVAAQYALYLIQFPLLAGEAIGLVQAVAEAFTSLREGLCSTIAHQLESGMRHGLPDDRPQAIALRSLHDSLVDHSFEGTLRRFAGHQRWDGSPPPAKLEGLADVFVKSPGLMARHVAWLTSGEANNAWEFGSLLGAEDSEGTLLDTIIRREGRGPDLRLQCAYVLSQAIHRGAAWVGDWIETRLAGESQDEELALELWKSSEITPRVLNHILDVLRRGGLDPARFLALGYGRWALDLPAQLIAELAHEYSIRDVLKHAAIEMINFRLQSRPQDVGALENVSIQLVVDSEIITQDQTSSWRTLAISLLVKHPVIIARAVLEAYFYRHTFWFFEQSPARDVLARCVMQDPASVWPEFARVLGDDRRSIRHFVGFPPGINDLFPHELLLKWADESPSERAYILAKLATPDFGDQTLAGKLAEFYGDIREVDSALYGQIIGSLGGWGSMAERVAERAAGLERIAHTAHGTGLKNGRADGRSNSAIVKKRTDRMKRRK